MIEVEITGRSVPRFSRAAMREFVLHCVRNIERIRSAAIRASEISVAIIGDDEMCLLNRDFRGKNQTTDVLTFPADESYSQPGVSAHPLGDIVISLDQASRQAASQKHSIATEVRYLLLHGIIHAFGFDHETDAGEMNALELKLREKMGLE